MRRFVKYKTFLGSLANILWEKMLSGFYPLSSMLGPISIEKDGPGGRVAHLPGVDVRYNI